MFLYAVCVYRKALDNNLNQVWLTSGFVKKGLLGEGGRCAQSRRFIKPGLGRSYLRIFVSKWQGS